MASEPPAAIGGSEGIDRVQRRSRDQSSGIELFTLRYNSPELGALSLNLKKGEKAPLKYDPQDISVIYVHDQGLPDSASMSPIETKEDAKEINPLMGHPTSQAGSSHESGGQKKPTRNSVSSGESARARSPQIIAESLPLDQPGWSADYSLPTGNASEEAPQ
jgi:hypothetical protein